MHRTSSTSLPLLARALLIGVGPAETARALGAEFGWDAAVLTLADLPEPEARAALWTAVAAQDDLPSEPPHSAPPA